MKKVNLIVLAVVAICLLAALLALGQGGNSPASTKESGATSVPSGSQVSKSDKRTVSSPELPKPIGPYSEAVVAGGFVFVSGQGPFNTKTQKMELGDIKSETRLELTNISNILKASNSSLENVVKVSVFLADLNDFEAMNEVYREFFKDELPARTTVQAVLLTKRKVVFDCIARVNP